MLDVNQYENQQDPVQKSRMTVCKYLGQINETFLTFHTQSTREVLPVQNYIHQMTSAYGFVVSDSFDVIVSG